LEEPVDSPRIQQILLRRLLDPALANMTLSSQVLSVVHYQEIGTIRPSIIRDKTTELLRDRRSR